MTATILSGVSAALGGAAAKTALSTASALTNSAGAEIKAEFYQNLLAGAIVRKIREVREVAAVDMANRAKQSSSDYTVSAALADVQGYHAKCSFYIGLVALCGGC